MADPSCSGGCDKTTDLQRCSKCKSAWYCSQACQKKDWKSHKKLCPILARVAAHGGRDSTPSSTKNEPKTGTRKSTPATARLKNLETHIDSPFTKLDEGTYLHGRSEKDVFQILIDSFRLRSEDEYTFNGDADADSIYGGCADSRVAFRRYLKAVKKKAGYLPTWWTPEKAKECIAFGMDAANWSDLRCAVEKSDINEHYDSPMMAMQLRMFAENVLGSSISPMGGGSMMGALQMMAERGDLKMDTMNMSSLFSR